MTLTHTMTLTDDQAELLAAWSKAELDKHGGHAPAAAYVLNSLIQSHLVEWVRNKWKHDEARKAGRTTPVKEANKERKRVRRVGENCSTARQAQKWAIEGACKKVGYTRMTVYKNGPTVSVEEFALTWWESDSPFGVWQQLLRHDGHQLEMPDDPDLKDTPRRWVRKTGNKGVALRMSILAARLRKAGVPMKQMKRGRKAKRG